MKIKRYQSGGIVYTPFIPNKQEQATGSSDTNKPEKISGTFTKEVIDVLKENGIPNDVDAFLQEADSFLNRSNSLSRFSIFGGDDGDHNLSDVVRVQSLANKVKFNKQLYDAAANTLTKEGSWAEVATDNRGNMYVYSEDDGIELISPTEFHKDPEKYSALTNAQLMSLRESQPGLAYDQNILNNMTGSVGMQSITNYVKGVIKDFGTSQLDGYVSKSRDKVENGLQELMMGGPNGSYQYSLKSQVDKDDEQDIDFALNYLYGVLPENMKSLLRAKAAAEGMDPNSRAARQQLLYMALMEHTSESVGVKFDGPATTATTGGSGGNNVVEKSYIENVATVGPVAIQDYRITPSGSRVSLDAKGQNFARPITRTGNEVAQNNVAALFGMINGVDAAYAFSVADKNSVTFGDSLIPSHDLTKLLWDGTSDLIKVWMPYTTAENGAIVPDFQLQKDMDEVASYIADHPGMTDMQIRELINNNLQGKAQWDPETDDIVIDQRFMTGFLTLSVYAGDDTVDFDTKSPYIEKVDRQIGKQITDLYDNFIQYNQAVPAKNSKANPGKYSTSTRGDFWKGNIFVPITNIGSGVLLGNSERLPRDVYTNIQQKVQRSADQQPMITTW